MDNEWYRFWGAMIGLVFAGVATLVIIILMIQPVRIFVAEYSVDQQKLQGEAELKRAEQNRQIKIEEAQATQESAVFLAQAEVARARGVAEANEIIAEGLGGPEGYLRYLWIQTLEGGQDTVYVPTEANIPILEATRRLEISND
jgi:hypothetical protein